MKPDKGLCKAEVCEGGGVSKGNVILIAFVCLLVGFILGATVAILKTQPRVAPTPAPMVGPTVKESGKNRSATDYQEEIQLSKSILEKDRNNLQALISLGNAYLMRTNINRPEMLIQRRCPSIPKIPMEDPYGDHVSKIGAI